MKVSITLASSVSVGAESSMTDAGVSTGSASICDARAVRHHESWNDLAFNKTLADVSSRQWALWAFDDGIELEQWAGAQAIALWASEHPPRSSRSNTPLREDWKPFMHSPLYLAAGSLPFCDPAHLATS